MSRNPRRTHRLRAGLALLILLLLLGATASAAQDENVFSEAPEIDQTPVVLSRTVTPNATNVVVEFPIQKDTYVTSNKPTSNWCTSNWLRLGYNKDAPNNGAQRIFLKFDLSSIPSEAAINSARFRIYMHTATPSGDSSMRIESRHLLRDWDDCAVTWSSHQPNWGQVFGSSWVGTATGWLEGDVTELVKDWVYGTHPNNGAMLMGDETVRERQRIFYSSYDAGGRYPRLIVDYTVQVDNEPPVVTVNALPQWSGQRFDVSWGGYDPGGSGIDYYDVQYRVAGYSWIQWLYHTRKTSAEFAGAANGQTYEFRARGVDKAGNVQAWTQAQAWTTVDSIAPYASVNPLPPITLSSSALISWTGSDNSGGSGIKCYDLEYREDDDPWLHWLECSNQTSALGTGGIDGVTYGFRVRAIDNAGNVQAWSNVPQAETTVNLKGPIAQVLPFSPPKITDVDQNDFLVRWSGEAPPGTTITSFNIRYSYAGGAWILWQSQTQLTQATFTDLRPEDGSYCFEAQATDSSGRTGDFMGRQCIYVDKNPPYMQPVSFLPEVDRDHEP